MHEFPMNKTLSNGLKLEFSDATRRYYGDYYRVCVEVRCALAQEDYCDWYLFKTLDKMAVASDAVEEARQNLVDEFFRLILPYMQREDFPQRFVVARQEKRLPRR